MSSDRFIVTKTSDIHNGSDEKFLDQSCDIGMNDQEKRIFPGSLGEIDLSPIPALALYEEEIQERPRVTTFLKALSSYTNIIPQSKDDQDEEPSRPSVKSPKLSTLMGVYLPCVQNILGVILFVRLPWIVGLAGIIEGFLIVFLCVCTTLLTSFSMSAIATNGVVPAGGSYFMISRALGPEFGGAVGFLFYLGTTFASSLYILGAVEILLSYIASYLSLFGEFSGPENKASLFNNFRVYGTLFLFFMSILVFVGVKLVNKFASIFLACVITSILSIYIGIIKSGFVPLNLQLCFIGNRLLQELKGDKVCNKYTTNSSTNVLELTSLYKQYCKQDQQGIWTCDSYFEKNNVSTLPAIPGLGSNYIEANFKSDYLTKNDPITSPYLPYINAPDESNIGGIVADLTSSFTLLLAIFFPSVTGIMAGSNRSGDLADGQKSIPKGTIGAVLTTGFIYLSCVVLFGLSVQGPLLQDKFGDSIGKELIVSILAWPSKWVVLIGAFLSTIGAGLQSLTGAPRLLQAIGKDSLIPVLNIFAHGKKNGEPTWALLLTTFLSCCGILIADLDVVAPVITMFFLMCYMFVNLACALHSLLKTPNWRPRYKYYHWFLSLIGVALCITLMFISSWYYALGALAIAATIYKYIEYSGAQKEWGDGLTGLQLTTARFALLRLEHRPPHTKNWRPQLLVLVKFDELKNITQERLLSIAEQLKAGKGLTVVASVHKGNSLDCTYEAEELHLKLAGAMEHYGVKGFQDVCVCKSVFNGLSCVIQTSGLGGLRPNTIVIGWPHNRLENSETSSYSLFLSAVREASAQQKAILIPKFSENFPTSRDPAQRGTIDVWWIVHDGGLLMLLPFLLRKHKVWKNCKTRIFTVAKLSDNSLQMKNDLNTFVYHLRIQAEVEVVEMHDSDISAYTYERTLRMEQRTEILQQLCLTRRESLKDVHQVIEKSRGSHASSKASGKRVTPIDEASDDGMPLEEMESRLTWAQSGHSVAKLESVKEEEESKPPVVKPKKTNVRRMHNAIKLNEAILKKSRDASLVILNLPGPPKGYDQAREANYMEFLEILTEQLDRVLMVRGGGREVITIYS